MLHTKNEEEQMIQAKVFLLCQEGEDSFFRQHHFAPVWMDKNAKIWSLDFEENFEIHETYILLQNQILKFFMWTENYVSIKVRQNLEKQRKILP